MGCRVFRKYTVHFFLLSIQIKTACSNINACSNKEHEECENIFSFQVSLVYANLIHDLIGAVYLRDRKTKLLKTKTVDFSINNKQFFHKIISKKY